MFFCQKMKGESGEGKMKAPFTITRYVLDCWKVTADLQRIVIGSRGSMIGIGVFGFNGFYRIYRNVKTFSSKRQGEFLKRLDELPEMSRRFSFNP